MLREKTTFVIGAGASVDVGLPTGLELKSRISGLLNIKFDDWGRTIESGDSMIALALRECVRKSDLYGGNINPLLHKAWQIAESLPTTAISIDNYLEAHDGDQDLNLLGKIGISKAILDAERHSQIRDDFQNGRPFDLKKLEGTWYQILFQFLTEGLRRPNADRIFENAAFVIFNYDRCFEHALHRLIEKYYALNAADVSKIMETLNVIHPYGTVGRLRWQGGTVTGAVDYGGSDYDLLHVASRIRTFTEGIRDESLMEPLREAISESRVVIFLGFSYGRQNLNLMRASELCRVETVYGTSFGLTPEERRSVENELRDMLGWRDLDITLPVRLYPETCAELLKRIGRSITA